MSFTAVAYPCVVLQCAPPRLRAQGPQRVGSRLQGLRRVGLEQQQSVGAAE